jgi:hypothetical protein
MADQPLTRSCPRCGCVSRLVRERVVAPESEHRTTAPPPIGPFYSCVD